MEPNLYRVDIRRIGCPFAPGDVVEYIGKSSSMSEYSGNRREGIVLYCANVWSRNWVPETQWACRVDWNDPNQRSTNLHPVSRARYQARNLRLVRPLERALGWVWPIGEGMRAEDV